MKKEAMSDSARKILKILFNKTDGLKNKEIIDSSEVSEVTVAAAVKLLQKKKYIERDPNDHRKYKITESGKRRVSKTEALERIEESGLNFNYIIEDFGYNPKFTALPMIKSFGNALSKEKIVIDSYLAFDNKRKDTAKSIIEQLQKRRAFDWVPLFFSQLGDVVAEKHFDVKSLENPKRIKDFISLVINQNRAKMDYTAALLISFHGAEVAEKIDWEARMKNADADSQKWEEEETKKSQFLRKAIEHDDFRKALIEEFVISYLSCNAFGDSDSSTPDELKANLAKHIKKHINDELMMFGPEIAAEIFNGISNVEHQQVETLIRSGAVITKPRYVFEIDKEKLHAQKQKNKELLEAFREKIEKEF